MDCIVNLLDAICERRFVNNGCGSVAVMDKKSHKQSDRPHTLVGVWVNGDEYATEVEYVVSAVGEGFGIRAIDRYDGEEAEVYDVKWDGKVLSFATHWPSTGRFVKCRLQVISQNRVDYTYTYTQQEMWHRKKAEPTLSPNRRPARQRRVQTPGKSDSR